MRGHTHLFLRGERRTDQQPQDLLGQIARQPKLSGAAAHTENDFALALVVTRWITRGALRSRDFTGNGLPPCDKRQQLAIQLVQLLAQFIQSHEFLERLSR